MSKQYIAIISIKQHGDNAFNTADKINTDSFQGLTHSSVDDFLKHYNIECECVTTNRFCLMLNNGEIDIENNYFAQIKIELFRTN